MTQQQLINMVLAYVKQACGPLKMDSQTLEIKCVLINGIPHPLGVWYNYDKSCIEIDLRFLIVADELKTPTALRMQTYSAVYEWYIDYNDLICADTDLDSTAYAYLLCNLFGLHLQNVKRPGVDMDKLHKRALEMLNEIFHMTGSFKTAYFSDGIHTRKQETIVLSDKSFAAYMNNMIRSAESPLLSEVSDEEQGSFYHPFPNIDEACAFVKKQEVKAYEEDEFLHDRIEVQPYVYDGHQFKVEWANPFVAHKPNDFPEDAFIVNEVLRPQSKFIWYSLKPNLYRRKFLFRGQSQYYSPCKPSLFRTDKPNYLEDLIWGNEMTLVVRSHPLVRLFEQGVDLLHDVFHFSVNYYGLQQHYYNKTSMLDLTSDIEAARFFAVTDYCASKDEYSVHKDDGTLGVLYYYDIEMPRAFRPKDGLHLSIIGKQPFMRSGQQHGFLLNMPKEADFNTLPHVHKVFFRHDDVVSQRIFEESENGKRYFPEDLLETHWKKYNTIYKEKKIVSLDAIEENHKYNRNISISNLKRQLKEKGYSYDKHLHPAFDHDELHAFHQDMKNGLWEKFCRDIYFYGPENDFYRELLLQAEHNEEYRKFFYGE